MLLHLRSPATWSSRSQPSGFTLLEMLAAIGMLAVLAAVAIPCLKHIQVAQDALAEKSAALRELKNLSERARVGQTATLQLSATATTLLPEAQLETTTAVSPDDPQLEQVTLSLSWVDHAGVRRQPMELILWRPLPAPPAS
ncbi:type IV pilin protein [Planctomicrobium sp. SH664]|uniref:type IV pilin protein n=1 Tax=Planctomicrobium sp. SH664 TaxID=3448125 RepID=UPI003F5BDF6A